MTRFTPRRALALTVVATACLAATPVSAAEVVPSKLHDKAVTKVKADGHAAKMSLGATGSANSSSNVVGAAEGTSVQIGVLLQGSSVMTSGQHEVQTEGKVQHTQTRTPVMDSFVKSTDVVELQSTWTYRMGDAIKIGPFARLKLGTQLLGSVDLRPNSVTVKKTLLDGTVQTKQVAAEVATSTTGSFEPLLLTETAGLFVDPLDSKPLTLKLKLGAGGQEIIARNGFALTGYDAETETVSLKQLDTSTQVGGEFEVQATGVISDNTSWTAKANFFAPVYSTSAQNLKGMDALQTDIAAALSIKLSTWAKLDYVFNVKRVPLIVQDWQVQHGLMLTTGFNLL